MKYTRILEINKGDVVDVLTDDGWLTGNVLDTTPDKVKVEIVEYGEDEWVSIDFIK